MISFQCPKCGKDLKARPSLAGVRASCTGCQAELTIPHDMSWLPENPPIRRPDRWPAIKIGGTASAITSLLFVVIYWQDIKLVVNRGAEVIEKAAPAAKGFLGPGRTVAVFRMTGNGSTPSFTVSDDWSFTFKSRASDESVILVNDNTGERDEASLEAWFFGWRPNGGTYHFEVVTTGPWKLTVTQHNNRID